MSKSFWYTLLSDGFLATTRAVVILACGFLALEELLQDGTKTVRHAADFSPIAFVPDQLTFLLSRTSTVGQFDGCR